jgi:hypothetical protein
MDPPKSRPLVVEAHILAYLGQYINVFEKKMRERILKEADKVQSTKSAKDLF